MVRAFLLLGSNEGDRSAYLQQARIAVEARCGKPVAVSAIYETAAWGITDQPGFLNQVMVIETKLAPHQLLHTVLAIESSLGRIRTKKWAGRTMDIDILFYGDHVLDTGEITIPHPAIAARRFTLVPLVALAPDLVHPVLKKNMKTLLDECEDGLAVRLWEPGKDTK